MSAAKASGMNKRFWTLAVMIGVVLLAIVGVLLNRGGLLSPTLIGAAPLDSDCHLEVGACTADLPGGGEIEFSLDPKPLKVAQPMRMKVVVKGRDVRSVDVDFVGLNMNMGFIRPHLDSVGPGVFSGKGLLPVCTRRHMDWEARVLLETPNGVIMAPFRFSTDH